MMKDRIAGVIRKITVPPELAAAMLLIFRMTFGESFISWPLLAAEMLFLVLVPVSAYPISMRKDAKNGGRESQRKLAFIMNLFGYGCALAAGIAGNGSQMLLAVLWGYFLAVILLILLNKLAGIRASGHACSCTLPYLFFCRYLGIEAVFACLLLYLAEFWASVRLKRHTAKEFLLGSLTALFSFFCVEFFHVA